jgi:hypothetical protein
LCFNLSRSLVTECSSLRPRSVVELVQILIWIFNIFYSKLEGVLESGNMASSPSHLPPGNRGRYKNECNSKASPGLFLEGLKGKKSFPRLKSGHEFSDLHQVAYLIH